MLRLNVLKSAVRLHKKAVSGALEWRALSSGIGALSAAGGARSTKQSAGGVGARRFQSTAPAADGGDQDYAAQEWPEDATLLPIAQLNTDGAVDKWMVRAKVMNAFEKTAASGNTYFKLTLADASGSISATLFGPSDEHYDCFKRGNVIEMWGKSRAVREANPEYNQLTNPFELNLPYWTMVRLTADQELKEKPVERKPIDRSGFTPMNISQLSVDSEERNFKVTAKLMEKSLHPTRADPNKYFLKCVFSDGSGAISASAFDPEGASLDKRMQIGKVYDLAGLRSNIRQANSQFSAVPNDYQLLINEDMVTEAANQTLQVADLSRDYAPINIAQLSADAAPQCWKITAKLMEKSLQPTRADPDKYFLKCVFSDGSGAITASAFDPDGVKLADRMQVNSVYEVSGFRGSIRPAQKQYTTIPHDFQLSLRDDMVKVAADQTLQVVNLIHNSAPISIAQLSADTAPQSWKITAKLMEKSLQPTRADPDKYFLKCVFSDGSGAITASAFDPDGVQLADRMQVNSVYEVSGFRGSIRPAQKQYTTIPHDFQLSLRDDMVKVAADQALQTVGIPYNLTPLKTIFEAASDEAEAESSKAVDLVAVVVDVGEVRQTRFGDVLEVTLTDLAGREMQMGLWGKHTEEFPGRLDRSLIVAFRNVIVSKQHRLSLYEAGAFELNPPTSMPEVAQLDAILNKQ